MIFIFCGVRLKCISSNEHQTWYFHMWRSNSWKYLHLMFTRPAYFSNTFILIITLQPLHPTLPYLCLPCPCFGEIYFVRSVLFHILFLFSYLSYIWATVFKLKRMICIIRYKNPVVSGSVDQWPKSPTPSINKLFPLNYLVPFDPGPSTFFRLLPLSITWPIWLTALKLLFSWYFDHFLRLLFNELQRKTYKTIQS